MTRPEMLKHLSIMVDSDDIPVLDTYLLLAEKKLLALLFPYSKEEKTVPFAHEGTLLEIACYLYNKRGAEGEIRHSENGIDRTYGSADLPKDLLNRIVPYAEVIR